MTFKTLGFQCVLVTGGGGGIGLAMSQYFQSQGKKVIICGRTESKLKTASREQLQNCPYYVLDTGDIKAIPDFIQTLTKEHPELDCLVNNAGVQRPLDVNEMSAEEFLQKADNEVDINVRGPMHLAVGLLPHFRTKKGAVVMNISSILGYIPTSIINPVYNATKSAIHFWSLNLRTQLAQHEDTAHIRVIEIAPPSVTTDLHRERKDPHDNTKDKNASALSLEEFMSEVVDQWKEDKDTMGAGPSRKVVERWFGEFGGEYAKAEGK